MLTKNDFEKAAETIAKQYMQTEGNKTINQLAKKIASDNNLNPDQIRTMVRLANVSVFGKLFQTKTGEDKNIQFETGDPEVVIDALYDDTKTLKLASNADTYDQTLDFYGDMYTVEQAEKTAAAEEDPDETKPIKLGYSKKELVMQLKRASDRFDIRSKQAEQRWKTCMETATSMFNKTAGMEKTSHFSKFEKDVLAANTELIPEVQALRVMSMRGKVASPTKETLEKIANTHVANLQGDTKEIFEHLKQAAAARLDYQECRECLTKIDDSILKLS